MPTKILSQIGSSHAPGPVGAAGVRSRRVSLANFPSRTSVAPAIIMTANGVQVASGRPRSVSQNTPASGTRESDMRFASVKNRSGLWAGFKDRNVGG